MAQRARRRSQIELPDGSDDRATAAAGAHAQTGRSAPAGAAREHFFV
jgi:hypothetical protein